MRRWRRVPHEWGDCRDKESSAESDRTVELAGRWNLEAPQTNHPANHTPSHTTPVEEGAVGEELENRPHGFRSLDRV